LAFWDELRQELLLARDPLGKKPLYYTVRSGGVAFASEVKALFEWGGVEAELDEQAVVSYLMDEYVLSPRTGYKGVVQVPRGSFAKMNGQGQVNMQRWWRPKFEPKRKISVKEAEDELDGLLMQSVKRRMVADVPVGVLLSGGLDSTTIAWYMKKAGVGDLHSFSVSFGENSFDESGYAQQAAFTVGCEHSSRLFGVRDCQTYISKMEQMMDIPLGDSSLLPTWSVCDLAREKVKVVLDGDGSDELLGGYGIFPAAEVAERLPQLPRSWWSLVERGARFWPTSFDYFSFDFKLKSFLKGLGHSFPRRHRVWLGSFDERELNRLLTEEWRERLRETRQGGEGVDNWGGASNWFDRVSALTIDGYLQNDILAKLDRASMFTSLEARTPFLDVDLTEFLMQLPLEMKQDKMILRRLMRGRIPASIIDRTKRGFAMPLAHWLRGDLYDWAKETLSESRKEAVFKTEEALRLLEEHCSGRQDHRKKLWTLLALRLWQRNWL